MRTKMPAPTMDPMPAPRAAPRWEISDADACQRARGWLTEREKVEEGHDPLQLLLMLI